MTKTVAEVIAYWRAVEQGKYTPRSFADRDRIVRWFEERYGADLAADVTPASVIQWIRASKGWASANTRRGIAQLIHHVFQLAVRHRLILANPVQFLANSDDFPPGDVRRPVTWPEAKAILRCSDKHFRRILWFLWLTGCRPGEAEALTWADVDLDRKCLRLAKHKTVKKTRKPRIVPLEAPACRMLAALARRRGKSPFVFTNAQGTPWTAQSLSGRKATLVKLGVIGKDVYWHGYRHSYATIRIAAGAPLPLVAQVLGNSETVCRKVYVDLANHSVEVANQLDMVMRRRA